MLLVQFLVLAFTGALWWLARRDLKARPAPPQAAGPLDLEPLLATLETVVTDLARRLDRVERQIAEGTHLPRFAGTPPEAGGGGGLGMMALPFPPPVSGRGGEERAGVGSLDEPQDARYAPVYALLDEGITDPQDIARRTGLSRGEVDLILSLRGRRTL